MKFNVGDYVRVKPRDQITITKDLAWMPEMDKFCENVYQITGIDVDGFYKLDGAFLEYGTVKTYWVFMDDWLELEDMRDFDISEDDLINLIAEDAYDSH